MSKRNHSLQQLRQEMTDLQKQINLKEKELNIEIGAWVRKQTNLDTLHEIQQNFRLVTINNDSPKTTINTHTQTNAINQYIYEKIIKDSSHQ